MHEFNLSLFAYFFARIQIRVKQIFRYFTLCFNVAVKKTTEIRENYLRKNHFSMCFSPFYRLNIY